MGHAPRSARAPGTERAPRLQGRFRGPAAARLAAAALAALVAAAPAGAVTLLSPEEALGLAFPGCRIERGSVFLTDGQLDAVRRLAGVEVPSALVRPHRASCGGKPGGTAYFDVHRVRTLPETVMVAVGPDGRVLRVEVVAFREPLDYVPRDAWYEQFEGERLDRDLALDRDVRGVTGATLTARATTDAVRRVLAIHRVLDGADRRAADGGAAAGESTDGRGSGRGKDGAR